MQTLHKLALLIVFALAPVSATTLQKLELDEMIQKATGALRGKVVGSYAAYRGTDIYTFYRVQVVEELKTASASRAGGQMEVAVPGGAIGTKRQATPGAPSLSVGQEYVLFYWTSKTGLTQLIGLSQGLFGEQVDVPANPLLVRPAASETMLDRNGNAVQDTPLTMRLADMKARVKSVLSQGVSK